MKHLAGIYDPGKNWNELANECEAITVVERRPVEGAFIPCRANPCGLICRCKGGRKTGICFHILFVTHMIYKWDTALETRPATYNLSYMGSKIAGAKKRGKRPKRVKHCLLKESSDEEEGEEGAPKRRCLEW